MSLRRTSQSKRGRGPSSQVYHKSLLPEAGTEASSFAAENSAEGECGRHQSRPSEAATVMLPTAVETKAITEFHELIKRHYAQQRLTTQYNPFAAGGLTAHEAECDALNAQAVTVQAAIGHVKEEWHELVTTRDETRRRATAEMLSTAIHLLPSECLTRPEVQGVAREYGISLPSAQELQSENCQDYQREYESPWMSDSEEETGSESDSHPPASTPRFVQSAVPSRNPLAGLKAKLRSICH